jgi:serine O-acetyltransferase
MKQVAAPDKGLLGGDRDENPRGIGLLSLIREDLRTHDDNLLAPGFWALCAHRLGNARMRVKPAALRAPLSAAYQVAFHGVIALWGIDLPYNVRVGRRLRIEHHGCLMVGARAIGDDVIIRHSVTMGLQHRHASEFPTIGDGVEIGPGACIVGGIHIGDGAYIGPNSVVARDVRPGTAVIGIPPRPVDLTTLALPASAAPASRGPASAILELAPPASALVALPASGAAAQPESSEGGPARAPASQVQPAALLSA